MRCKPEIGANTPYDIDHLERVRTVTSDLSGRPRTTIGPTPMGRDTVAQHRERLTRPRDAAREWTAPDH